MANEVKEFYLFFKEPLTDEEIKALNQPERFVFGLYKLYKYINAKFAALEASKQ